MYRCSPFSYMVGGMLSTGLSGNRITCSPEETTTIEPRAGQTCQQYMDQYINGNGAGGYVTNPDATSDCQFCAVYVLFTCRAQTAPY